MKLGAAENNLNFSTSFQQSASRRNDSLFYQLDAQILEFKNLCIKLVKKDYHIRMHGQQNIKILEGSLLLCVTYEYVR